MDSLEPLITPTPAQPRPSKPKTVATPTALPEQAPQPTTKPEPELNPEPQAEPVPPVGPQAAPDEPEPQTAESQAAGPKPAEPQPAEPQPAEPESAEPEAAERETELFAPNSAEARDGQSATTAPEQSPGDSGEQTVLEDNPAVALQPSDTNSQPNSEGIDDDAGDQPTVLAEGREEPAAERPGSNPDALNKAEDPPTPEELAAPEDPSEPKASGEPDAVIPPPITNPDRLTPSTSVVGSARDQVHDDGSLIKPTRKGPLAGLRERLGS